MNKFSIQSSVSKKLREIRRIIGESGVIGLPQAIYRHVQYHLISKWQFVYLEFPLDQEIFSFDKMKDPVVVRIAARRDLDKIEADVFPLLEGEFSYDRRYFQLIGQPRIKCFLAERHGRVVHYSWVFMDAFNSLLTHVPFDKTKLKEGDSFIGPVFTSPAFRGLLIYPYVLSTILHYLKSNNHAKRVIVFVQGSHPSAVDFYKRLGFREMIAAQPRSIFSVVADRLRVAGIE